MWTTRGWTDYEVIDASGEEKLERWGKYVLLRPDSEVIWRTPKKAPQWKRPNAIYHRSSKGGGEWEIFNLPQEWEISYLLHNDFGPDDELRFRLQPFAFKHTGLFPEQAVNWEWYSSIIRKAKKARPDREIRVLNLFAYTGGATMAAAMAGAHVTHVDSSKGMVTWAKENAQLTGVPETSVRWLVDDCKKFVGREARRGKQYDAIIMDPPSYGRGPKGEIWKLEDALYDLVDDCRKILVKDPLFFLVNTYVSALQTGAVAYIMSSLLKNDFGGTVTADEIGVPVTASGLVLPCGCSGRLEGKL